MGDAGGTRGDGNGAPITYRNADVFAIDAAE